MTAHHSKSTLLGRLWRSLREASEAAVGIRYEAPWAR